MMKMVLWIYIALLCAGGLIGYLKAGSLTSLLTSVGFAIPLALCALGLLPRWVAYALIGFLGAFFIYRLVKSAKFMPAGLMVVASVITLILLLLL